MELWKEIMMLLGDSMALTWFHFPVQCTCCRWPEGIHTEKTYLAIICCLLYQKVQSRYKCSNRRSFLVDMYILIKWIRKWEKQSTTKSCVHFLRHAVSTIHFINSHHNTSTNIDYTGHNNMIHFQSDCKMIKWWRHWYLHLSYTN